MHRTVAALAALLPALLSVGLPAVVAPPASASLGCGFGSSQLGGAIPDGGTMTSSGDLSGYSVNDPLYDLDVTLDITHPWVSDLTVTLSYGGSTVVLVDRRGAGGDNFTATRFDDGAATAISAGTAPFTGSFRPEQSLNVFDDLDPGGVWTLRVTDHAGGDVGTLHGWKLTMKTRWCDDKDRDTVKNDYDLCWEVKGEVPHGCPVRARTVSILYNQSAREFRGVLRCSTAPRCAHRQPLRIFKVVEGADQLVARTFTTDTGTYAYPRASVAGQYYAVAPKVVEEGLAECQRAQSTPVAL